MGINCLKSGLSHTQQTTASCRPSSQEQDGIDPELGAVDALTLGAATGSLLTTPLGLIAKYGHNDGPIPAVPSLEVPDGAFSEPCARSTIQSGSPATPPPGAAPADVDAEAATPASAPRVGGLRRSILWP